MLRTCEIGKDACDLKDDKSQEIILTVWRAKGESDKALIERAGNIARNINNEIRQWNDYTEKKNKTAK